MENTVKNIVSEAISQAKMEASSYDRSVTLEDIKFEINCIVEFIKFETTTARNIFMGSINVELRKSASCLYPAKMQMNADGNYTSNPKYWV